MVHCFLSLMAFITRVRIEILIPLKAPIIRSQGHQVLPWGPHVPLPDQSLIVFDSMSTNNPVQLAARELGQGGLRLSPTLRERLFIQVASSWLFGIPSCILLLLRNECTCIFISRLDPREGDREGQ